MIVGGLLFCFAVTGMTLILVQGVIFEPLRNFLASKVESIERERAEENSPRRFTIVEFLHKVIQCPQCAGFWCGIFCGLFVLTSDVFYSLTLYSSFYSSTVLSNEPVTISLRLLACLHCVMLLFCCGAAGSFLAPLGDLLLSWIYVSKELKAKQLLSESNSTTEQHDHQHTTSLAKKHEE
jgi:hypothetical protein